MDRTEPVSIALGNATAGAVATPPTSCTFHFIPATAARSRCNYKGSLSDDTSSSRRGFVNLFDICTMSDRRLNTNHSSNMERHGAHVTVTRGICLIVGRDHVALGLTKELVVDVANPGDCRVIIVVEDAHQSSDLSSALEHNSENLSNVCVTSKGE